MKWQFGSLKQDRMLCIDMPAGIVLDICSGASAVLGCALLFSVQLSVMLGYDAMFLLEVASDIRSVFRYLKYSVIHYISQDPLLHCI